MTLDPLPLIHCFLHLHFTSLGNTFSAYLASPPRGEVAQRAGEGQHDVAFTSANTSFLFPPVPHPRELLLCDAEAERGFRLPLNSYRKTAILGILSFHRRHQVQYYAAPLSVDSVASSPLWGSRADLSNFLLGSDGVSLSLTCLAPWGEVAHRAGEG